MKKIALFIALFVFLLNHATAQSQCGSCVNYVNAELQSRGYNRMPAGLLNYNDYVAKLTPTSDVATVNSVGYGRAWNDKTKKFDHPTVGHVFIVNKVNADGTLEISEANFIANTCKVHKITPSKRGKIVYWTPTKK